MWNGTTTALALPTCAFTLAAPGARPELELSHRAYHLEYGRYLPYKLLCVKIPGILPVHRQPMRSRQLPIALYRGTRRTWASRESNLLARPLLQADRGDRLGCRTAMTAL